jgi:hypothetical protein
MYNNKNGSAVQQPDGDRCVAKTVVLQSLPF